MDKLDCEGFRRQLKPITENLRYLISEEDRPEVAANLMLAYRHLEDASMRLGKAIQVLDGGISVYDKTQVPDAAQ